MTLGIKIQELRMNANLSQKELAEKIGTSTGVIAEWESNEATPTISDIIKLCSTFDITTDSLILETFPAESHKPNENDIASYSIECETPKRELFEPLSTDQDEKEISSVSANKEKKKKFCKPILIVATILLVFSAAVASYFFLFPFSIKTHAIAKAEASVVKVFCYDSEDEEIATGSGFIVFNDKTIVTNYHVVDGAVSFKISTDQDKTFAVKQILYYSKDEDVAILELEEGTNLKVLKLGDSDKIKKGETVTAIGSPLGIKNTVSKGILSGRMMMETMDALQFTAPISQGSSGGALFNEKGEIVGITYASFRNGQNLNLAVPSNIVTETYLHYQKNTYKQFGINCDIVKVDYNYFVTHLDEFDGKAIMTTAYYSSYDEKTETHYITVSDKIQKISGNSKKDFASSLKVGSYVLGVYTAKNINDSEFKCGEKVCIVTLFNHRVFNLEGNRTARIAILGKGIIYKDGEDPVLSTQSEVTQTS